MTLRNTCFLFYDQRGAFMGLFDGLMGNATQKDTTNITREVQEILIPTEQVELAFKLVRDLIIFTDRRMIIVDKQGMTGKKANINRFLIARFHVFRLKQADISI